MRILLVEDEASAARMLAKGLREHAYAVDIVADGESASAQATHVEYDAIVLDVMLPKRDGLEVCRSLRAAGNATPVLMVTARDSVDSRVEGLDAGADDYLVKPFNFRELLARVRALVRRRSIPLLPDDLRLGPLVLKSQTRELFVDGDQVQLTAREYALLEYLGRRAGDVVSRRDIAQHVWDDRYDPLSNVIDVYVQRLRRKIDRLESPSMIRARRGEGYQLVIPGGGR
jgi:two-component system copper resistance phosphate regulon response regulator CusR